MIFPFFMSFTATIIEIIMSAEHLHIRCRADRFTFILSLNIDNSPVR